MGFDTIKINLVVFRNCNFIQTKSFIYFSTAHWMECWKMLSTLFQVASKAEEWTKNDQIFFLKHSVVNTDFPMKMSKQSSYDSVWYQDINLTTMLG